MTQYIQKLPSVFQTVTEKKFFNATFDQVFSKKDSSLLYGYIGRRTPGVYNPISDFYLPEPSKDRTWWQLEATAFSQNADTTKTNIFFYDDLLSRINFYGGNTLNQNRLFESEYYSWSPPIDVDMFANYQNYYWLDQGLPVINITGVVGADIIGKTSYITPATARPPNLALTSGMKVILTDESSTPVTIENIGDCTGIRLVPQFPDFTPGTILEFLPWDSSVTLVNSRVIDNTKWDTLPWDAQTQPGNTDYITIERGALDRNAWSRTNKWYHIGAINATIAATKTSFPADATRALRPIIQFTADLTLYRSGTQFRSEINYGFRNNQFGQPLRLGDYQNQLVSTVTSALGVNFVGGELVSFFNDNTSTPTGFPYPWDLTLWEQYPWDTATESAINNYIFQATVNLDNTVTFNPYIAWETPIANGDIVFITSSGPYDAALRGQTWYYSADEWQEAANDKTAVNQPPVFQLFDHNGVELDSPVTYPLSTFSGSKIFSYKINTTPGAYTDTVLKFPIVYTSLGQASDIMFQNNLITDRYTYGTNDRPISGYYYYTITDNTVLYNNWNLYQPCPCNNITPPPPANCLETSKQRVIDRYVVGYGAEYQFKLSVTPYGYIFGNGSIQLLADTIVSVNGAEIKNEVGGYVFREINNTIYADLTTYLTSLLGHAQTQPPVVEVHTYTHGLLDPASTGYFEIPQQLEANPTQLDITEISGSNLSQQFTSIIQNQIGATGVAFGGNNYRDTIKNRSVGAYILQNVAPLLKTMLVSSSEDLDFIAGVRFSQTEYTKFKNKYLKTALQLINKGFDPAQYYNNSISISAWVEEILKVVNISNEFSNAFAYSYMIANGSHYVSESHIIPIDGDITLTNYIDLSDLTNALYIYDKTGQETLLVIGRDYEIVSTNLAIDIQFNLSNISVGNNILVALYKNPIPAYIPSTPSKLGTYPTFMPRVELDTSYAIPTHVIIGHDGSKTILTGTYDPITKIFSDYRDALLIELEVRIYNLIQYRFRHQYYVPLRVESVKNGYFRETRYTREEYLDITESYLNKWSAGNRANYHANDWYTSYPLTPVDQLWKLYNYNSAIVGKTPPSGQPAYYLPGNWKGIFQYYYDTIYPATRPWEMLGFSEQPSWWVAQYGAGIPNTLGELAWPNTPTYALMWADLEYGIIRQGPSAIYDPIITTPQEQPMWARPGLSAIIPVDASGDIVPVPTIFDIAIASSSSPFDHFDVDWKYGDGSPVEQAWMSTSAYAFSVQEFLYLMRPAAFGELLWDTTGTQLSPGTLMVPGVDSPVMSNTNWQYVQNDVFTDNDPFFSWMRPKNASQVVHAETVNGIIQLRFGYQRWISDRILFLGKNITTTFGQLVRTLNVNLANKLAGFTNKDTTTMYIESISPNVSNTNLLIPTNNFTVSLHQGQPTKTYSYSGVIVRALENGMFAVYGYDLLNSEFTVLERSDAHPIDITVGGTPAEFQPYTKGQTYSIGDIVRYNGVYYMSNVVQTVNSFIAKDWTKLKSLPTIGGISVTYRPISGPATIRVPYGSIFKSVQEVFDLLIGWGAYLETQGWKFDEVSQETNLISDWLYSGKQFLFWLNTNWAPDASIQLSPSANHAKLTVQSGYPNDVEAISNGVYSILDKFGIALPASSTSTNRVGQSIDISPVDPATGGIYFLQISSSEIEHILMFDNSTSFGDIVYDPLLRVRQDRLRFNGSRSNGWYGKMEAPGYLVIADQLVPNYDTIVDAMRYYYDPDVTIDNPSLEDLGRHLIGFESKSYLDNLQVSNDVQYLFYQGAIRQKGTIQSFDKLFRSTKVRGNETIEVYEEWALKVGNFGNTVEQISTEFTLIPEQNSGEVIVSRLNYTPSTIGSVKQINILNAQHVYINVPTLVIAPPDASLADLALTQPLRQARGYIVLNSSGIISRVDITDEGYGYLAAPAVDINAGASSHEFDKLYSVWQGEIIRDISLDNIIEIDIDDTALWTTRPNDLSYSLEFPTTDVIDYALPNAGYVNFNDIKWTAFDNIDISTRWGTKSLNPGENDTIWVANTFTTDWGVYKMVVVDHPFDVTKDDADNLVLRTPAVYKITPQLTGDANDTDFGNMVCMQVTTAPPSSVDPATNYIVGIAFTETAGGYNYYNLVSLDNVPLTETDVPGYLNFTKLMLFKAMRFSTEPDVSTPTYVYLGDKIWVDNIDLTPMLWNVYSIVSPSTSAPKGHKLFRKQEPLINTLLFESARIYDTGAQNELTLLPIYDPFKGILPAPAKQNISWISSSDPTQYNVTGNPRLYSSNIAFGEAQVGKIWWDLSNIRYVYYEQPIALDGSEGATDNLVYRRDRWGQIFPGSTVDIYEWTKSPVPPGEYVGTGTPRTVTDYVQIVASNRFTNITQTSYYFWVANTTGQPAIENRTLSGLAISRLLLSPKSQRVEFFAPIQQTSINNSYMFYNVQDILIWRGNNVQIQYRLTEREDQKHTQWKFFREGDPASVVTDQFWNKMVDSLCGYTKLLPISDEWAGIFIASALPWDIYGWDIAPWDDASSINLPTYGKILPVPDPRLSANEKYGIDYRPRQSMFVDLYTARKVFVQSSNNLLQHIPIKDDNPSWSIDVPTSIYWKYVTWYAVGFENVVPTVIFATQALAQNALAAGSLATGTIVQVVDGTVDGRFALYNIEQVDLGIPAQSLQLVAIEESAINLLDTVYTTHNAYNLSTELRQLLNAFRNEVFVDTYIVDQNELYFSMLNYVTSEQKNLNWLFKTSYIYVKENNIQLTQDSLYIPDQINNIIGYITDTKPYHTQIRDYTSTYQVADIANGTAIDSYKLLMKLSFGPQPVQPNESLPHGHNAWGSNAWGSTAWGNPLSALIHSLDAKTFADDIAQIVSREDIYTFELTVPDPSKKGYSLLFPYTFNFDSINLNNPQTFFAPSGIIGIQIGATILFHGQDYYVENNNDTTYTVYFFNDPAGGPAPVALVWFDGGQLSTVNNNTYRDETAKGTASDDLVINVDTKLPVNLVEGNVFSAISDIWDYFDPAINSIVTDQGGQPMGFGNGYWDEAIIPNDPLSPVVGLLDNTISFRENTNVNIGADFYRNADIYAGTLVFDLLSPTAETENIDIITISVTDDILPNPENGTEAIWIDGERIEYRMKIQISANTWELRLVRRGTNGTAPDNHLALTAVWIERANVMPSNSNIDVWNAIDITPTPPGTSPWEISPWEISPWDIRYTGITSVPLGGLWYAQTAEAVFLKQEGTSIP